MFNSNDNGKTDLATGILKKLDSFNKIESRIYNSKKYRIFSFGASVAFLAWAFFSQLDMFYIFLGVLFLVLNIISFFLSKWRESHNEEQWFNKQLEEDTWEEDDASDET